MGKKKPPVPNPAESVIKQAQERYNTTLTPGPMETQLGGIANNFQDQYNQAARTQTQDYGNIMSGYNQFRSSLAPTDFNFERVSAKRPEELGEAYGYLRETVPGYRDFATTGGYSDKDIQELRARSVSPIRSAYGNTMMELNRARSLGGSGGAPNYIAAASRAQRELPGQMADAMTGINAELARDIRQGKLAGLAGISGIGSTMGGLSSDEAARILQADLSNQAADLQAQQLSEQSRQANRGFDLNALSGMTGLYGTTPGMANMFGNQALSAWQNAMSAEQMRNQYGLNLLDTQLRGYSMTPEQKGTPWWKTALSVAGTVAPYVAMAASSRELKTDIQKIKNPSKFAKYLKELPLYTWKYKGDDTTHMGPMAEEFKKKFGIGDGKTLHLADVMGITLAAAKESYA